MCAQLVPSVLSCFHLGFPCYFQLLAIPLPSLYSQISPVVSLLFVLSCDRVLVLALSRFIVADSLRLRGLQPPGSSVHGVLQARVLECVARPPPGALPHPGTEPASLMSPALAGGFFTPRATWEGLYFCLSVSS